MAGSILVGVSVLWVLFEGMGYHLMTLICHCLMLSLSFLFFGSYAAPFVNRLGTILPSSLYKHLFFKQKSSYLFLAHFAMTLLASDHNF